MKRKTTLILFTIAALVGLSAWNNPAYTYREGPQPALSGAPGEGTCTSCHFSGTAGTTASISTDVDSLGYIPGKIYNITATVSNPNVNTFGFEISAKAKIGSQRGTLINKNTQTQIAGTWYGGADANYISQTSGGTAGTSHSKTWTFQWTAPVAGTADVGIYASFLAANGDGGQSGDATLVKSITIKEATTTGLAIEGAASGKMGVYPNPAHEIMNYTLVLDKPANVNAMLTDISGRSYTLINNSEMAAGVQHLSYGLSGFAPGVYLLHVTTTNNSYVQKVIVQ